MRGHPSTKRPFWKVRAAPALSALVVGTVATVAADDAGLRFRIGEGAPEVSREERGSATPAAPLGDDAVREILGRLPALEASEAEEAPFALPPPSLPPPRTGRTVHAPFPRPEDVALPRTPVAPRLEVVRRSPEGAVPVAFHLSATFSQPMVALTSHAELEGEEVPVRVSPIPDGTWRWVGTKTVLFEPRGTESKGRARFPMATEFQAEVPAGTRSALGGRLSEAVRWRFSTPPPSVRSFHPSGGPHGLKPAICIVFDQAVEARAVLPTIRLTARDEDCAARLATEEEVEADKAVRRLLDAAEPGRAIALVPEEPLPAGSVVRAVVGPGTPSAEGPLKTTAREEFTFQTAGALEVTEHLCGWSARTPCTPGSPLRIRFSNPLDATAVEDAQVRVEPELSFSLRTYGSFLEVRGRTRGSTRYTVTLASTLRDVFGQTLGREVSLEFDVGPAPPELHGFGGPFVVLDPASPPRYSVATVNQKTLEVTAHAVEPGQWGQFLDFQRSLGDGGAKRTPPGRRVLRETVEIEGPPNAIVETSIDLSRALEESGGRRGGQLVVVVRGSTPIRRGQQPPVTTSWVLSTKTALDAFVDDQEMLVWATALQSGSPLAGVDVTLLPSGIRGQTGRDGLARLRLPSTIEPKDTASVLVGSSGGDLTMLPEMSWGGSSWRRQPPRDTLVWYVFDDRKLYRPGEEARVKGWLRLLEGREGGDVAALPATVEEIGYRLLDPRGEEIQRGTVDVSALGGFDLGLEIPKNVNLGWARVELSAKSAPSDVASETYYHVLRVAEFRRPEFEVDVSASAGPHVVGGHATTSVEAKYYAGGGLPGAEVRWRVTSSPGSYRPPGWGAFTFGTWVPWWRSSYRSLRTAPPRVETFTGQTDARGIHRLRIDFDTVEPARPTSLRAEASVEDVNRQAWADHVMLLVHPSSVYVGLRSESTFVEAGKPLRVETIVTDIDGAAVAGHSVELVAHRVEWRQEKGAWVERETLIQRREVISALEPIEVVFETTEGGQYGVGARVTDRAGRANESELTLWVAGGKRPSRRGLSGDALTLVPDRKEYRPGDVARILVVAPFAPGEGLVTLRRSGIVGEKRFSLKESSRTIEVPLTEEHVPNVHVHVEVVGAAERESEDGAPSARLPRRPAFATASLNLHVAAVHRTLAVELTPAERELEPGGRTEIALSVRDPGGAGVEGAEVALVAVDEAVLAMTDYALPDPIGTFYRDRPARARDHRLRPSVLLETIEERLARAASARTLQVADAAGFRAGGIPESAPLGVVTDAAAAPSAVVATSATGGGAGRAPIRLRVDLSALALFAPQVTTGPDGTARVPLELPDSLTRYRVMAVAVSGPKRFGTAESSVVARLPLMVRPSLPRFLNYADELELPVVLQNQTDEPLRVDIAARTRAIELVEGQGRRVTVPARDRVEVRLPARAVQAGTAAIQVGATSGRFADAAKIELPIWTPATTEAFATYGEIDAADDTVVQPVRIPADLVKEYGGLQITTSSTAVQALTDAVLYLTSYPYDCAEQISSRLLAATALRDVLAAFCAEGLPSAEELQASVRQDIRRLRELQRPDGGFGFWRRGGRTWPYVSIHAAHALARAHAKDFAVDGATLDRSREYLRAIKKHLPASWPPKARIGLAAYALHVRRLLADARGEPAAEVVTDARSEALEGVSADFPIEAAGWLLGALAGDESAREEIAALRQFLTNRAAETASTAEFASSYTDGAHLVLHSSRRTDAVALEGLLLAVPECDLSEKLARGLLAHRTRGRWRNTQENCFVLLALGRFFEERERETPDFVARTWLGQRFAAEESFRGRSTTERSLTIPMSYLAREDAQQEITLAKTGTGRLYYRLGLRYAPSDLRLAPVDHGFTVERTYEALGDERTVRRDLSSGAWRIRAGAEVRVRLRMVAPARRYHVALVDPIPAGLEPLQGDLAVVPALPRDPEESGRGGWWWYWRWYEHENLRDDRIEAFTSLLRAGVYTYTYVARATTPGTFVAPPPRAEEMYSPETFGRGATDIVIVEE